MKHFIIFTFTLLLPITCLKAQRYKENNYDSKRILYVGWQASNHSMTNAYSNNLTDFYDDSFFMHRVDCRIGTYRDHYVSENDLSGFLTGLLYVYYAVMAEDGEDPDDEIWKNRGGLRKISENFEGYEGRGADWSIWDIDWAFGAGNVYVGPSFTWAGVSGITKLSNPSMSVQEHGFGTYQAFGLTGYYFMNGMKFKLNTSYFLSPKNKVEGLIFKPEVTIMPVRWFAISAYYKFQSADLGKSDLVDHESLGKHTVNSIGVKCALVIR